MIRNGNAARRRRKKRGAEGAEEGMIRGGVSREEALQIFFRFFTALYVMQTRYSDENSVCPSVRPSVRYTRAL